MTPVVCLFWDNVSLVNVHFWDGRQVVGLWSDFLSLAVLFLTPCLAHLISHLWSMIEHSDFD